MDNQDKDIIKPGRGGHSRNSVGKGMILLLVGVFFLLKNMDLAIPDWVLTWQMLVIGIGLIIWVKSEFRNIGGLVMIVVGGVFLLKFFYMWPYDLARFIWPAVLIFIGLCLMMRKQMSPRSSDDKYRVNPGITMDDYINSNVTFSGENRIVVSKALKGGRITAIFGGADINLTQADFEGMIEIEATCVFGGVELVVPSNWNVKVDVHTIFGGVEDKRPVELMTSNPDKVLIVKGKCVFGGIEIKSYN